MLKIATTENAAKPFCLIDSETGRYVRKQDGCILTFKTREAALRVIEGPANTCNNN